MLCIALVYIYIYGSESKNIGLVTGLGGHFATKVQTGVFCDRPLRDKPLEEVLRYSTQRSATRVCNRGPATMVCNRGGAAHDNTGFDPQPYMYIYVKPLCEVLWSIHVALGSY